MDKERIMYAAIVRANGEIEYYPKKHQVMTMEEFEQFKRIAHMQYAEVVRFGIGPYRYIMLVDEDGKYRNKDINKVATALYENPFDYIVGDVVIVDAGYNDGEMYYMTANTRDILQKEFGGIR